jgi:Fur family ferric uptake transcriptional regulator
MCRSVDNMEEINLPKGIKWTKQRKDVYRVLSESIEPVTALDIYQNILVSHPDAGYALSTIYRILTVFEENGIVSKSSYMEDSTIVYELERGEHTHYAVCLNCHKRIPLQACPFAHIHAHGNERQTEPEKDALEQGFIVTGHKLELYGYCINCKEKLN